MKTIELEHLRKRIIYTKFAAMDYGIDINKKNSFENCGLWAD
jgi:hypothetical protein